MRLSILNVNQNPQNRQSFSTVAIPEKTAAEVGLYRVQMNRRDG